MRNILLMFIVVILCCLLFVDNESISTTEDVDNNINIKVLNSNSNNINEMDLEDYVIGVVAAEMPATFNLEALKAQAVASRSYALFKIVNGKGDYDIVSDVDDQVFIDVDEMKLKWGDKFDLYYKKVSDAVSLTKGEILTYDDLVIEAFYYSMSNGYTEDSLNVFGEDLPYIKSVESRWDNSNLKNFDYNVSFTKDEFCNLLDINCSSGIDVGSVKKLPSGRVETVVINNTKYNGVNLRKILGLRSADFNISIDGELITVGTKGYGHGVGMSQYGANGMANEGYSYVDILNYYYKNIKIEKISV